MVWACEKDHPEVAGMEAKYRRAQRQAKEMMDGQGGCQSQEDLHWRRSNNQHCSWTEVNGRTSLGLPVLWYKVLRFVPNMLGYG